MQKDKWRDGGVDTLDIIRVEGDFDACVSSASFMKGRLREGDLVVALEKAGDCFHHYMLLHSRHMADGRISVELVPAPFGAYGIGRHVGELTQTQMDELQDGGDLMLDLPLIDAPTPVFA